jgi:hypothetical protein
VHRAERQCLLEGQTPNNCEVPKTAGRNTKANVFQKGSAGFKTTIDLNKNKNKKKVHPVVSVYVKFVDLISLKHHYKYMEREGETIKTDGRKLLLDALELIGIIRSDRVRNSRGIFQLGPDKCEV